MCSTAPWTPCMSSCWPSSTMWLWSPWQRTQGAYQALIFWEITSSWVRHLYYKSALEGVHMAFSPPSDRTATWTAKKDPPASSSSDTLLGQPDSRRGTSACRGGTFDWLLDDAGYLPICGLHHLLPLQLEVIWRFREVWAGCCGDNLDLLRQCKCFFFFNNLITTSLQGR